MTTTWTLMSYEDEIDAGVETYRIMCGKHVGLLHDEYFMVPQELAAAYEAALDTVANIEKQLDKYREENGHRKKIRRRTLPTSITSNRKLP